MKANIDLQDEINRWLEEGLITSEQAAALHSRVAAREEGQQRVQSSEILIYVGSLVVSLAVAFLAILNWEVLGSAGRVLVVWLPLLLMFGLGVALRRRPDPRLQRGAEALWFGACLLAGVAFMVVFDEASLIDWRERGPTDFYFLFSCLIAGAVAAIIYLRLPGLVQSVPFHFWFSLALISFLGWLDMTYPPANPWRTLPLGVLAGAAWLALGEWLLRRGREQVANVSRLVGAVTVLAMPFLLASSDFSAEWQRPLMEFISFATCAAFIVASVRLQSRIFLYSGVVFLVLFLTYLNFERFADKVGLPITLFIAGVTLIVLGLGAGWLNRSISKGIAARPQHR